MVLMKYEVWVVVGVGGIDDGVKYESRQFLIVLMKYEGRQVWILLKMV